MYVVVSGSVGNEPAPPPPVTPGTLVAEPYSWKSLVTGQPILRLRTTAIRAAVLCLPAGYVMPFLTLCILMDFLIHFDTRSMGLSIVHFKG